MKCPDAAILAFVRIKPGEPANNCRRSVVRAAEANTGKLCRWLGDLMEATATSWNILAYMARLETALGWDGEPIESGCVAYRFFP